MKDSRSREKVREQRAEVKKDRRLCRVRKEKLWALVSGSVSRSC
jgi:hypothetical protein